MDFRHHHSAQITGMINRIYDQCNRYKIIALITLLLIPLFAQNILVSDFDTNNIGSINGQGNWKIENGSAIITTSEDNVHSGSQALQFTANNENLVVLNTTFTGTESGVSGIVYFDAWIKINSLVDKYFTINGYDLFGGSEKRAFAMEFNTPSGNSGDFRIYDGSSKTKITQYTLGEWCRISALVNYQEEYYQVIFNDSDPVTVNFRESYTPTASGGREAGTKEYHRLHFNLGYDGATGSVDAVIDDIYISTNPISDVDFPAVIVSRTLEIEQPTVGNISIEPNMNEYPDSTEITATLSLPTGYKNNGWTGDLSGTDLEKTFLITKNMTIGAEVIIDAENPPTQFNVVVTQPDTGEIVLSPAGNIYYDYTEVTATLDIPVGYKNSGWTGDLSGTELKKTFIVHDNMEIGATVVLDTTPATIYTISNGKDLKSICLGTNLKPGDIVEVENGTYDAGGGITVESSGTASKPIIIRAKNTGEVELSGATYFNFRKAEYITLEGFNFTSANYTVVKLEACNNIRITKNTFQLTESEGQSGKWVYVGGYWNDGSILSHHNRIDHNIFRDKHQLGNFITIDGGDQISQHDRIDHNYFYNIGPRHENEMEAVRVGVSGMSLTDGFAVIEYNLFEECDGDPEIISIKSCKDTIRYNTIRRCQGTVSLRQGLGSVIHDNFFLGDGKKGTGGVRIYARDHKIYNNYFEGLSGYTWDAAITLTNGDTESGSESAHWQINNLIISNNTMVNNYSNIEIGYNKSDNSWKKVPKNVTMTNNLVVGGQADLVKVITSPSNFTWENNIMFTQNGVSIGVTKTDNEIRNIDPEMIYNNGLWQITQGSPVIDAGTTNILNITEDIQGQIRSDGNDIGADEFSSSAITRMPLQSENVGPFAIAVEIPTAINEEDNESIKVEKFNLLSNYPNPFNGSTTIKYELLNDTKVHLIVFDINGRKVLTLQSGFKHKGNYQYIWNTSQMSSGTYYLKMITGDNTVTRKILLLK